MMHNDPNRGCCHRKPSRYVSKSPTIASATLLILQSLAGFSVASIDGDDPQELFLTPPGLQKQVVFWKKVFAEYHSNQVLIHDSEHLGVVYRVIELGPNPRKFGSRSLNAKDLIEHAKKSVRESIHNVQKKIDQGKPLNDDESRLRVLVLEMNDQDPFQAAVERVRAQRGLSDRFARGIEISQRYLAAMERIFENQGLPPQLTRLPLIESSFDVRAESHAGAVGIWQFIRATGKRFLQIGEAVDERRDPLLSTVAAARLLKENYIALSDWALAITAYNHGKEGVKRAVESVGSTDIADIVRRYRGRAFGFASRNFFAEFLAALEVEKNQASLFGDLEFSQALEYEEILFDGFIPLDTFAKHTGLSKEMLLDINPALTQRVATDRLPVPRGFRMRVPASLKLRALEGYHAILEEAHHAPQKNTNRWHRVSSGETLSRIAKRYGVKLSELRRINALDSNHLLVGQQILIPDRSPF